MKDKIFQAFTRDEPDILDSVLRDCPEKASAPKKFRPRKRWMELVAAAVVLAMMIPIMWSTVVYVMDRAPNGFWQQSGGPGVPTDDAPQDPILGRPDDPSATDGHEPDPSVPDTHPPAPMPPDIEPPIPMLSFTTARDLVLSKCGVDLEEVAILKMAENNGNYEIYFDTGTQAWQFLVDGLEGTVLNEDEVECGVFPEDSHLIGWKKIREIGLAHSGKTLNNVIGFTWDIISTPYAYTVELYFDDGSSFLAWLDAETGEFSMDWGVSAGELLETVLNLHNIALEDPRLQSFEISNLAGDDYRKGVCLRIDDKEYFYSVNRFDLSDLQLVYTKYRAPAAEGAISPFNARQLALAHLDRALSQVTCFQAVYLPSTDEYWLHLNVADKLFYGFVNAIDGTVRELDHSIADCQIDEDQALELALYAADLTREQISLSSIEIAPYITTSEQLFTCYQVIFTSDSGEHRYRVSTNTGAITGSTSPEDIPLPEPDPSDLLAIRDIALSMSGYTMEDVQELIIEVSGNLYTVSYEAGQSFYCFEIDSDSREVVFDYGSKAVDDRADEKMEHLIGWKQARNIALEACGRTIDDMISFKYEYRDDLYYVMVYFYDSFFSYSIDALDGNLVDKNVSPPDDTIDTDKAVALALHYTGLKLEEVTELAVKYDDVSEFAPCYWVYFKHDGISYELCVNRLTAEVTLSMGAVDPQPE